MRYSFHRSRRVLVGAALLVGASTGSLVSGTSAHAQLAVCYGDPLVFTDSGAKLRLQVAIQTDAANVQSINYVLHMPVGSNVTKVITTGGKIGRLETVVPVADEPAGNYVIDTSVTSTDPVAMTAYASFHAQGWDTTSTDGVTNGNPVEVTIQP